jgi:hypothetical protein
MTDCKHDWHFIHGTSRLECRRCKVETGPSTPDQLTRDMFEDVSKIGTAWSQDGKRIDPWDVYKISAIDTTEYKLSALDTTDYLVSTGQLYTISDIKPNHNITLSNADGQVGCLDFNGPQLVFTGEADKAAQVFLDWVSKYFDQRLKDEREAGRKEAEEVTWGIDWGRAGEKACATIIKRLPNGKIKVMAVEYQP